ADRLGGLLAAGAKAGFVCWLVVGPRRSECKRAKANQAKRSKYNAHRHPSFEPIAYPHRTRRVPSNGGPHALSSRQGRLVRSHYCRGLGRGAPFANAWCTDRFAAVCFDPWHFVAVA